ncbi:C40 family peptidase [Dysosmobacter sp.]
MELKTRPANREVRARNTTTLAPQQLVKVMKDTAAAKELRRLDLRREEQEPIQSAVGSYEERVQMGTDYAIRRSYHAGKRTAQRTFDCKVWKKSSSEKTAVPKAEAESPAVEHAKQQFRKERMQGQRQKQVEVQMRNEQAYLHRISGVPFNSPAKAETMEESPQSVPYSNRPFERSRQSQSQRRPEVSRDTKQVFAPKRPSNQVIPEREPSTRAKNFVIRKLRMQGSANTAQSKARAVQTAQRGFAHLKNAVLRISKAVTRAAVGLLGGAAGVIGLVLVIGGAAAVIGTPFGVFWSGQDADAQSIPQAVYQINTEYANKISQIQSDHPADSVEIHRVPDGGSDLTISNWPDIVAVFAVKTASADVDATDVVTIDEKRIDLLRMVFWDMNAVDWAIETIPGGEDESDTTILHITITSKSAAEMPNIYRFNKNQRQALTELLKPEYAQMLGELVGTYGTELNLSEEEIRELLSRMPENLDPERQAVVTTAYSLLGKVNYFWGGKSSAIGWDSRWGTPKTVTAPGSRTTGTVRPFGLDCSGFVDWTFNNAMGYVIGHGGGAHSQHTYCTPISWAQAQPGDLVFYPGDTHVGIFVGTDSGGDPLIIHCASSQNNVVLTGLQGFTSIARPKRFEK